MDFKKFFWTLCLTFFCANIFSYASAAGERHEEFNLSDKIQRRGNIFDLFFGPAPPLATQRGILIIRAFHDRNNNGERDPDEEILTDKVSCTVDGISYSVPAFIPGLRLNGNFPVACEGEDYFPEEAKDVFVGHKGQIIRLELACASAPDSPTNSPRSSPEP